MKKVLVIVSEWGYWGEELVGPLEVLDAHGYESVFVTPKGKKPPRPKEEPERPPDLLAALRASLEAVQGGHDAARGNGNGRRRNLDDLSKDELYDLAKEADIRGRADMSKDELIEALERR